MCKEYRWVITIASLSAAFQSMLWLGFGIAGALTYLCLLPVAEYKYPEEFFPVTLVKLYFEGPKCILDGSYLGRFEEDRKSIDLFTPDRVFGVMIAYAILSAVYFVLSVVFYISRRKASKRAIALCWSIFTLLTCALDALFTYVLVLDSIALKDYLAGRSDNTLPPKVSDVPYIPILLALLSSRFVALWLWNFIIGLIIFMDALCYRNIIRKPQKDYLSYENAKASYIPLLPGVLSSRFVIWAGNFIMRKLVMPDALCRGNLVRKPQKAPNKEIKSTKRVENVKEPTQQPQKPVSLINSIHRSNFDATSFEDYLEFRKSMEETTRFNIQEKPTQGKENQDWNRSYPENSNYWHPKPQYSKEWDMTNEGFVSDEEQQEEQKHPDFDHDLRNFEHGQRKIKIVRRPQGKAVSAPIPPPMPPSGSCNC